MDFIGTPRAPTQRFGHVLDLTFSNIPFAQSSIRPDMHSGSDHETQVTTIPRQGTVPLEQFRYRIPETELPKFSGLVCNGISQLDDPWAPASTNQIDTYATILADIFATAIQTARKPDRGGGCPAP